MNRRHLLMTCRGFQVGDVIEAGGHDKEPDTEYYRRLSAAALDEEAAACGVEIDAPRFYLNRGRLVGSAVVVSAPAEHAPGRHSCCAVYEMANGLRDGQCPHCIELGLTKHWAK